MRYGKKTVSLFQRTLLLPLLVEVAGFHKVRSIDAQKYNRSKSVKFVPPREYRSKYFSRFHVSNLHVAFEFLLCTQQQCRNLKVCECWAARWEKRTLSQLLPSFWSTTQRGVFLNVTCSVWLGDAITLNFVCFQVIIYHSFVRLFFWVFFHLLLLIINFLESVTKLFQL